MQEIARRERPKMIIAGASAYARIIDFEPFAEVAQRDRREVRRRHGALRGSRRDGIASVAGSACRCGDDDDAQDAARAARRSDSLQGRAREGDRQGDVPRNAGRPLEHVIAAKAVAFKEALDPSFKEYCAADHRKRAGARERAVEHGFDIVSGGTDNHLMLVDLRNRGPHRQGRRESARRWRESR